MFATFRNTAIGAALGLYAGLAVPAQAAYVVTLQQVGSNVVLTGSGSLDTVALTPPQVGSLHLLFNISLTPAIGSIHLSNGSEQVDLFTGISGPGSFGPGSFAFASSATNGIGVQITGSSGELAVPLGYVSGTPLGTSILTFDNTTLTALGVLDGTYKWTWGTGGADADSFTLEIGAAAVPEPASLTLMAMGLVGLGMVVRTQRR